MSCLNSGVSVKSLDVNLSYQLEQTKSREYEQEPLYHYRRG